MVPGGDHEALIAVFGKHPGWDDHIDDIGLETAALVSLKRSLYIDGIGGNIDAGSWERLDETQRTDEFSSMFLSLTGDGVVLGRLWSSSDGKGRSRYPMITCAQCPGKPLMWAIEQAVPCLASVEERCRATRSADDVRAIAADAREKLTQASASFGSGPPPTLGGLGTGAALAELAEKIDADQGQSAFLRILYKMDRDMAVFMRKRKKDGRTQPHAQVLRLPVGYDDVARSLGVWSALMLSVLKPGADLLVIRSLADPWVDVVAGPVGAQQLYCLRAGRKALPCATDIPYGMDDAFMAQASEMMESWRNGSVDVAGNIVRADGSGKANGGVGGLLRSIASAFGKA